MWERADLRADLIGLKVGKLTVIEFHGINKNGHTTWLTECECGNTKIVIGKEFKRGKGGKQCDDCHIEEKRQRAITHGESKSKLYNMWHCMKNRCDNENVHNYNSYGGRGITYDFNWNQYENFHKDMLDKYKYANRKFKDNLPVSLERIDVNGNYCKDNCCFVPLKQQSENKRCVWNFNAIAPNKRVYFNVKNSVVFAKEHNLTSNHIRKCLREEKAYHKGWEFRSIKVTLNSKNKVNEKQENIWRFNAIAPNKRVYFNVKNATKFAESYGLDPGHVKDCLRKERKQHKGWTFREVKEIQSKRLKLKSR